MARPQNSPRGLFVKDQINVSSAQITGNSTGNLLLSGGLQLSDISTAVLTADSTGNDHTAGFFQNTNVDFDPGAGITILDSAGGDDIFVLKLDAPPLYRNYLPMISSR